MPLQISPRRNSVLLPWCKRTKKSRLRLLRYSLPALRCSHRKLALLKQRCSRTLRSGRSLNAHQSRPILSPLPSASVLVQPCSIGFAIRLYWLSGFLIRLCAVVTPHPFGELPYNWGAFLGPEDTSHVITSPACIWDAKYCVSTTLRRRRFFDSALSELHSEWRDKPGLTEEA